MTDIIAVIDFETTGMRAGPDRIIEVGAAILRNGEVVATFTELMNPGFRIPYFITGLTGITDAMVREKPHPEAVMPRLREFLGDHPCVAHNAGFDQRFFASEMDRCGFRECVPENSGNACRVPEGANEGILRKQAITGRARHWGTSPPIPLGFSALGPIRQVGKKGNSRAEVRPAVAVLALVRRLGRVPALPYPPARSSPNVR